MRALAALIAQTMRSSRGRPALARSGTATRLRPALKIPRDGSPHSSSRTAASNSVLDARTRQSALESADNFRNADMKFVEGECKADHRLIAPKLDGFGAMSR